MITLLQRQRQSKGTRRGNHTATNSFWEKKKKKKKKELEEILVSCKTLGRKVVKKMAVVGKKRENEGKGSSAGLQTGLHKIPPQL